MTIRSVYLRINYECISDTIPATGFFYQRDRMVFAGERYYNVNRIMLTTIGLWPYQKPSILYTAFFFSAHISCIFCQLTIFLTATYDLEVIINVLSYIFPAISYFLFYNFSFFNTKNIKQLFKNIKADWDMAEDSEIKILEKYAVESRLMSLTLICFGTVIYVFMEIMPIILDIVAPMNESRPRKIRTKFEMFLDEQQYFYVYLIFEILVLTVGYLSLLATCTLLFTFLTHPCAIYKIASIMLRSVVTKHTLEISSDQKVREMYWRIIRAVRMQRKAAQFSKSLLSSLKNWFFALVAIGVLSLSCHLLRFLITVTVLKKLHETIVCGALIIGHFMVIFSFNFIGQAIINHSVEIFTATYNTTWYLAPLPIQKLLLFIMQNSLKANTITIGGIFIASLEGFTTLTTASISYFTVLYNTK